VATIEWAVVCELGFFDRHQRMCVIGVFQQFSTPTLPLALSQVMLVAKLTDLRVIDELDLALAVEPPGGLWIAPTTSDSAVVEMANGYVLATLRDIPLTEEGVYRFQIVIDGQPAVTVPIPVFTTYAIAPAEVH
jgi:hypothetical protein